MKKTIKIIKVTDDTIVAFSAVGKIGCGTMMLNTKGKTKATIEAEIIWRFRTQMYQKKTDGQSCDVSLATRSWDIIWFDGNEIEKRKANSETVNEIPQQKPKIYSIEKKSDGSLKVNKIEGKLYDEDEVKIALCAMALNGER